MQVFQRIPVAGIEQMKDCSSSGQPYKQYLSSALNLFLVLAEQNANQLLANVQRLTKFAHLPVDVKGKTVKIRHN